MDGTAEVSPGAAWVWGVPSPRLGPRAARSPSSWNFLHVTPAPELGPGSAPLPKPSVSRRAGDLAPRHLLLCLFPTVRDPCVSLRTAHHPCPPPDPWALTDPALHPGSGSPGSAAPLLRTQDTATTAFTSGPDLCPGLQACHPWEASGAISASAHPKLDASPLSRPHLRPSCWLEPWARRPGPVCSQDMLGMVPLLRSWPSVQSPGHHPGPHPACRLSGRTPRCPRGPWGFAGRAPWQGRPGPRGPCPGGLGPVSLQFGDPVMCPLRGPRLQGLVTCRPPCRSDQTCQRRVNLEGPAGGRGC